MKPKSSRGIDVSVGLRQWIDFGVYLNERQLEVLKGTAEGHNTKTIAANLGISPKTVEHHRAKLCAALKRYDTAMLVRYAIKIGMIPQDKL